MIPSAAMLHATRARPRVFSLVTALLPHAIRPDRCVPPLDQSRLEPLGFGFLDESVVGRFAVHSLAALTPLLQALREIHCVPDDRVFESFLRSEQRRRDVTRREADPEQKWRQIALFPALVHLALRGVHRKCS